MVKDIVGSKNPILRAKAKEVLKVDKKIKDLAKDLRDTLTAQKDPEGVGLAAPQIGKSLKVFAALIDEKIKVVINPKVLKRVMGNPSYAKASKGRHEILEGCLSLINYYAPVDRDYKLVISYLNEKGIKIKETFEGLNAQIIQHEIDHLEGILFVDHVLKQNKTLYKIDPKTDKWEEVEL